MGIAPLMEIMPEDTMPTRRDVTVDELCIRLVAKIPINKEINGLDVVFKRVSAKPFPKPLKAADIRPMLTKNKYTEKMTAINFNTVQRVSLVATFLKRFIIELSVYDKYFLIICI